MKAAECTGVQHHASSSRQATGKCLQEDAVQHNTTIMASRIFAAAGRLQGVHGCMNICSIACVSTHLRACRFDCSSCRRRSCLWLAPSRTSPCMLILTETVSCVCRQLKGSRQQCQLASEAATEAAAEVAKLQKRNDDLSQKLQEMAEQQGSAAHKAAADARRQQLLVSAVFMSLTQ